METLNRCIEDASDYQGMMNKIINKTQPEGVGPPFVQRETRKQRRARDRLERKVEVAARRELLK